MSIPSINTSNEINYLFGNASPIPLEAYSKILSYLPPQDCLSLVMTTKGAVSKEAMEERIHLRGGIVDRNEIQVCLRNNPNFILDTPVKLDLSKKYQKGLTFQQFSTYLKVASQGAEVLGRFPQAKSLNLSGNTFWPERWFEILDCLPKELEDLDLSDKHSFTNEQLQKVLQQFPNLRKLRIGSCNRVKGEISLEGLKNLEALDASCCDFITGFKLDQETANLKELNLSYNKYLTNEQLQKLLKQFPNLRKLDISNCGELEGEISLEGLKNLEILNARSCSSITSSITGFKLDQEAANLKELDLSWLWDLTKKRLQEILKQCPNLQKLDISECMRLKGEISLEGLKNLEILNARNCSSITGFKLDQEATNLKELDLSLSSLTNEQLQVLQQCSNLRKLDISHCGELEGEISLEGLKNLEILNARNCSSITGFKLDQEAANLKELNLSYNKYLTNEQLQKILQQCPNLQKLDISKCMWLKGEISLEGLKKLEALDASCCHFITGFKLDQEAANLKELNLSLINLINEKLQEIVQQCPNLQKLDISECMWLKGEISLEGLKDLKNVNVEASINITSFKLYPGIRYIRAE